MSDDTDSSGATDDPFSRLMTAQGVVVPDAVPASPAADPFSRLMSAQGAGTAANAAPIAAIPTGSTITFDDGSGPQTGVVSGHNEGGAAIVSGRPVGHGTITAVQPPQTEAAAPIAPGLDPTSGFPMGMGPTTADVGGFGAGVVQGLRDVGTTGMKPLASVVPDALGGQYVRNGLVDLQSQNQGFQQNYGSNPLAGVGRGVGNFTAVAPLMMAAGIPLAAAGDAVSAVAPALEPTVNFLSGASQGNKLVSLLSKGTLGAEQGAAAATATSGSSDEPFATQAGRGAVAGGVLSAVLPLAGKAIGAGYNALTGGGVSPEIAALAQRANQLGVAIRGGQISSSPMIRATDSVLPRIPFTGYAALNDAQRTQFTRAVAGTLGENADALTQDVMQRAKTRIGSAFDSVAAQTTIDPASTSQLTNDLAGIENDASQVLAGSEFQPIKTQLNNIIDKVSSAGTIDGDTYQALTRRGAPLDRAASSSDPNVRYYATQIRGALDDALERSAPPDALDTLQTARKQWKNMRTVEDLAEKSPTGQISPALLMSQVRKSYPNFAYTGAGDLGDLAKIGQQFLKEVPNSGTPERAAVYALLGGGGMEGAAALLGHPEAAALSAAGAGATGLAARGVGAALNSNFYRNRLINSATTPSAPGIAAAVRNALAPHAATAGAIGYNQFRRQNALAPAVP